MAKIVGFIRAIGIVTDETFTPDIKAKLEKRFEIKAKLEEKFNLKGKIKK